MAPAVTTYAPRDPSRTVLYQVIADHLETFLASLAADPEAKGLPAYVQREFHDYLQCGILAHGFLRMGCDTCKQEVLLAFKRPCKDARALQAAWLLSLLCRPTYGSDRGSPGGGRDSLGADAAMGRISAHSVALLDVLIARLDRAGAYHHPHHHCAILCQPSRQLRR
jgi:hypothetical protein